MPLAPVMSAAYSSVFVLAAVLCRSLVTLPACCNNHPQTQNRNSTAPSSLNVFITYLGQHRTTATAQAGPVNPGTESKWNCQRRQLFTCPSDWSKRQLVSVSGCFLRLQVEIILLITWPTSFATPTTRDNSNGQNNAHFIDDFDCLATGSPQNTGV